MNLIRGVEELGFARRIEDRVFRLKITTVKFGLEG
jgi:hypothetical protein